MLNLEKCYLTLCYPWVVAGNSRAIFDNSSKEVASMKAGDLVHVHSMSFSGQKWSPEGVAKLVGLGDEKEILPFIRLNSGEDIPGPFQQWHVKFSEDDVDDVYARWIREEDMLTRLL